MTLTLRINDPVTVVHFVSVCIGSCHGLRNAGAPGVPARDLR